MSTEYLECVVLSERMSSIKQERHRFDTLDALRGIAALLVVQIHMPFLFAKKLPLPHAYLAVDFFFMLSGFVMAYAYGDRLREGWPTAVFLRERLFRLYPLFVLSIPLGILHLIVSAHKEHFPLIARELPLVILLGALVLPLPSWIVTGQLSAFPINGPSWSLFLEGIANIGHALLLRRRTLKQMIGIVLICNLLLLPIALHYRGIEVGFQKGQFFLGLVRVSASYCYGILLLQFWQREKRSHPIYSLLSASILLVFLLTPLPSIGNDVMDLAAVYLAFPLVILSGANSALPRGVAKPFKFLGVLSYAIYILHPSIFTLFTGVWSLVLHSKPSDHAPWSGMLFLPVVVLLSYLAVRFWDFPVRRFLKARRQPSLQGKGLTQEAAEL